MPRTGLEFISAIRSGGGGRRGDTATDNVLVTAPIFVGGMRLVNPRVQCAAEANARLRSSSHGDLSRAWLRTLCVDLRREEGGGRRRRRRENPLARSSLEPLYSRDRYKYSILCGYLFHPRNCGGWRAEGRQR